MWQAWDGQYTSGLKAGRFPAVIRLGSHLELLTTGRPPLAMRLALDTASDAEGVIVSIPMRTRRTVRVSRVWRSTVMKCGSAGTVLSVVDDPNGACVYDHDTATVTVVVKGREPLMLRALNSVRASLNVAMTEEEFYNSGGYEVRGRGAGVRVCGLCLVWCCCCCCGGGGGGGGALCCWQLCLSHRQVVVRAML